VVFNRSKKKNTKDLSEDLISLSAVTSELINLHNLSKSNFFKVDINYNLNWSERTFKENYIKTVKSVLLQFWDWPDVSDIFTENSKFHILEIHVNDDDNDKYFFTDSRGRLHINMPLNQYHYMKLDCVENLNDPANNDVIKVIEFDSNLIEPIVYFPVTKSYINSLEISFCDKLKNITEINLDYRLNLHFRPVK
jgi:hypothetical protein